MPFRIGGEEYYYLPRTFRFESEIASQSGWAILLHNVSRIRWLDDMKTDLIATICHEIKPPLTGIRMAILLLLEDRSSPSSEKQRALISSASGDCERLPTTLNNLLDLARVESGGTQLERVPHDIRTSMANVFKLFAGAAANRNVELRVEEDVENVPEVLADPVRLDVVLNNLVSNAIKHSPEGGVINLCLAKADDGFVRVSVIDRGAGGAKPVRAASSKAFTARPDSKYQAWGLAYTFPGKS